MNGNFVKDLSRLGRDLKDVVILDNNPKAYLFQPENGLPIPSWFDDPTDKYLKRYIPILKGLSVTFDARSHIHRFVKNDTIDIIKAYKSFGVLVKETAKPEGKIA